MTQTVDVRFGLAFVQLINVVSFHSNLSRQLQIFNCDEFLLFFRTKKIKLWNRTCGYVSCGTIINCNGMNRNTAALVSYDCHQIKFGNRISFCSISMHLWCYDSPWFISFLNSTTIFLIRYSADGNYEVRYKSNVLIYPNGEVLWVPPAIYQSSCTIDVRYFPFDQQMCVMKFGSWTFNGDQVSLALYNNKNFVDLSDYWKSGTWDIIEVPAYLNVYKNTGQPTETDITFNIIIRRKTLFYTVNLILPTVLISFLCVLVFYLPAEAGEKVYLAPLTING